MSIQIKTVRVQRGQECGTDYHWPGAWKWENEGSLRGRKHSRKNLQEYINMKQAASVALQKKENRTNR